MKVKFKKLLPGAVLPKKATEGSAAYDLYTAEDIVIKPGRQIIPLGFAMEMEPEYEALVGPRSGFSSKGMEGYRIITPSAFSSHIVWGPARGLSAAMLADREDLPRCEEFIAREPSRFDCDVIEGKIDSDYRGSVGVIAHNRDLHTFLIKSGTRIAQMTFHKVETVEWEETDTLSETDRDGGFGSTGTK